jgi:hypothetical protein
MSGVRGDGGGGGWKLRVCRHRDHSRKNAYNMLHNSKLWSECLDTVLIAGRVGSHLT